LPKLKAEAPGFSALLLLVNPDTNNDLELTLFEDQDAKEKSEEPGGALEWKLDTLADILDGTPNIENFELKIIS
jgi:hypothetical protein